jgi:hypothetical protein
MPGHTPPPGVRTRDLSGPKALAVGILLIAAAILIPCGAHVS